MRFGIIATRKVRAWTEKRQKIAALYDAAFEKMPHVRPLKKRGDGAHAYHLYVVRVANRAQVFAHLRAQKIGVNVHYVPVYLHPFYQEQGFESGACPVAEAAYEEILSLPIFPAMNEKDVARVVKSLEEICQ